MDDAAPATHSPFKAEDHLKTAKMANSVGLISVMLCLVSPCSSCMSLFLALPLSLMGLHYARTVLAEEPDEVSEAYARTGLTLSIVSLAYSMLMLMVVFLYVMLYVVMFAGILLGNI